VASSHQSNGLFIFSQFVFKIEYVVFKLVILGLTLFGLWKLVYVEVTGVHSHELGCSTFTAQSSKIQTRAQQKD